MPELAVITNGGDAGTLADVQVQKLRGKLRGELLRAGDPDYDDARRVWNGMVDKRPALIARCTGTQDVVGCINFAQEHQIVVSVRGGGHNYAGKAVCDGGLVIDLSLMKNIEVKAERRTVTAQAGLRLGEFDRETQKFGLATTLGVNTDTGIAGLTLGGGYGWLAGKYGLACDNLLSAEVVTAKGEIIHCSEDRNQDLFWGLRGSGSNFGVVTEFEYRLHHIGAVLGGIVLHPLGKEILKFFDEFSSVAPDELTSVGVVLTGPDGNPAFASIVCYCGALDEGERLLKALRSFGKPIADLIQPRSYLEMQSCSTKRGLQDGTITTRRTTFAM